MRKLLLLILAISTSFCTFAQLEVKEGSFKEVPGFVNINPDPNYQTDDNDLPFAVLKIRTENINDKQRRELRFSGNAGTFIVLEYKDGEVWVYLTAKYADYLKISHPDFSSIEYSLPFDIQPKKGYEMTLINKINYTPIPEKNEYNYLIIKADQSNAVISIDGQYAGEGEVTKSFKVGEKHTWKIECDLYYTEADTVVIVKDNSVMTIEKVLRPAYGYVNVVTIPENGAAVYVDNKKIGMTPCKSDKIKSGEHTIKVMKELFSTVEETFMITDGNTTELKINLEGNFVNVKVTTDKDASIYVDNELVGKGVWIGRMTEGNHVFEAKKESHRNSMQNCRLVLGKDENITIPNPEPIYGALDVYSNPSGATVIIDGEPQGTTPIVINNVLVGKRVIQIKKDGYCTETREVTIVENKKTDLNIILSAGKELSIETNGIGDKVFIDGKKIGRSPIKIVVPYGEHTFSARHGRKKASRTIIIDKQSSVEKVNLNLAERFYPINGFITFNTAINQNNHFSYGITIGGCQKYGGYVSGLIRGGWWAPSGGVLDDYPQAEITKTYYSRLSVMGGFMMNIAGPIYLRCGVGYGQSYDAFEIKDNKNDPHTVMKNTDTDAIGIDMSLGLQCSIGGFLISIDGITTNFKVYEASIGIGWVLDLEEAGLW